MANDLPSTTELPPYVISGERDWRPEEEKWKGWLNHPYGYGAYCVLEPDRPGEPEVIRIYPSLEAATPYMRELENDTGE